MKISQSKDFLVLAIITVVTVFAWIGFQVYREITIKKPDQNVNQAYTKPLNTVIREDVITKIEATQP